MAKISLVANPTFPAKVGIPVAGGEPLSVIFTFKHRTKSALDEFIKTRSGKMDTDQFLEMVVGWDIDVEFTRENVELLLENYIGAALATYLVYVDQLVQGKAKN